MPALILSPQRAGLPLTPYLTLAEFKAAPTGVEVSDLFPGGTQAQQDAALAARVLQASSWMDGFVHYVLGATVDTETAQVKVDRDGYVRVVTRGMPVLEVQSFSVGITPSQMASLAGVTDGWISGRNVIQMPVFSVPNVPGPRYPLGYGAGDRLFATYTYVNGYANTVLNASAAAAATSVTVASALGIYAGSALTIYDPAGNESVLVDASYATSAGTLTGVQTVPLASPLQFAHTVTPQNPVAVSALPPAVKEAAILATTAFIRTRGGGALVDEGGTAPREAGGGDGAKVEDLAMAEMLLARYVNPFWTT